MDLRKELSFLTRDQAVNVAMYAQLRGHMFLLNGQGLAALVIGALSLILMMNLNAETTSGSMHALMPWCAGTMLLLTALFLLIRLWLTQELHRNRRRLLVLGVSSELITRLGSLSDRELAKHDFFLHRQSG